jgi:hypothetical protein
MTTHLADVCCARLAPAALGHLGGLRARPGVAVLSGPAGLWLFWPAGDEELAREVLALEGAELYLRRDGQWRRPGLHLPVFDVPDPSGARPLSAGLFPAPVQPLPPGRPAWQPVRIALVRDDTPRPATALYTTLADLVRWADRATSRQIEGLRGACCRAQVLVVGCRLPPVAHAPGSPGVRFWGKRVLVPLGFRPDPALEEGVLREALRLGEDELALLLDDGVEVIPGDAFGPLTRAGIRLAGEDAPT